MLGIDQNSIKLSTIVIHLYKSQHASITTECLSCVRHDYLQQNNL